MTARFYVPGERGGHSEVAARCRACAIALKLLRAVALALSR
jgi:hypothetical protein